MKRREQDWPMTIAVALAVSFTVWMLIEVMFK